MPSAVLSKMKAVNMVYGDSMVTEVKKKALGTEGPNRHVRQSKTFPRGRELASPGAVAKTKRCCQVIPILDAGSLRVILEQSHSTG